MLLNNFRRVLVNTLSDRIGINYIQQGGMSNELITTAGNLSNNKSSYMDDPGLPIDDDCSLVTTDTIYNSTGVPSGDSLSNFLFFLGTGNTPPTIDDYKLSGALITGLTAQTVLTTVTNNTIVFSVIATNNTETPVTINELGLGAKNNSSNNNFAILLTRDVLPTPVTLNTGDSKTFSVTIDFRSLTNSYNNGN